MWPRSAGVIPETSAPFTTTPNGAGNNTRCTTTNPTNGNNGSSTRTRSVQSWVIGNPVCTGALTPSPTCSICASSLQSLSKAPNPTVR